MAYYWAYESNKKVHAVCFARYIDAANNFPANKFSATSGGSALQQGVPALRF